jgi:lipid A ethanolaminephosphotransferase
MAALLAGALVMQMRKRSCEPWVYWLCVVLVSILGTQITDILTDELDVSLYTSTAVFSVLLIVNFLAWYAVERNLSIRQIVTPRREIFYWTTVLCSFALQKPEAFVQVGTDAWQRTEVAEGGRHKLLVLVVGETARAMNFSLNGYERQTNPALARQGVLSFSNVSSGGTATAISVPCMFQDLGRKGWKDQYANHREGLLDVPQRAGISVLWRDNNSGCKGACDRVPSEDLSHAKLA